MEDKYNAPPNSYRTAVFDGHGWVLKDDADRIRNERDGLVISNQRLTAERDHWKRLFNRLEAAISHHYANKSMHFSDEVDDALYAARDSIYR